MKQNAAPGALLARPPLIRILFAQFAVLFIGVALLLLADLVTAYSALLGGLVSIGPNAYFTRWAFRYSGAKAAADVARSFYRGEAGKFLLTALLFASVFALVRPLDVVVFFLAYMFMVAVNWILALRFLTR